MTTRNIFILLFLFHLCEAQKALYPLPGKIAVDKEFFCEVFERNRRTSKFPIRPKRIDYSGKYDNHLFGGFLWLDSNRLLATESIRVAHQGTVVSNLVVMNIDGEVIDTITDYPKHYYMGSHFPTRSGRKILCTSTYNPPPATSSPTHAEVTRRLNPIRTLFVLSYPEKERLFAAGDFMKEKGGMFRMDECPWSPDEERFVYSIQKEQLMLLHGKPVAGGDSVKSGSYIFDTKSGKDLVFIQGSYQAVWSPVADTIAYLKSSDLWLYDVAKNKHTLFVASTNELKLEDIHWSPEGTHLYVQCTLKGKRDEKLYDVGTKNEVVFKKPHIPSPYYTWK